MTSPSIKPSAAISSAKLAKLTVEAAQSPAAFTVFLEFATPLDFIPWKAATTRNATNIAYLINMLVRAERDEETKQAFELFTSRLQPHLEHEHWARVQYIASDMIVVAARTHDLALFERVVLKTIGGDAGLPQLTDARLAFNIACMHAKLARKEELLRWAGRGSRWASRPISSVKTRTSAHSCTTKIS